MLLNARAAIIPTDKLRDYLLSSTHPIGRYKSAFFRSLGYAQDNWHVLESDLRATLSNAALPLNAAEYGQKFAVRGALTGPNGRSGRIVTVWIILTGDPTPRFVTAYPEE
jgi:uncharacterized protein DUF6883